MRSKIKIILYFLISAVLFQNCGESKSSNSSQSQNSTLQEKATFSWLNENIIQPKCISCHQGSTAFAGLEFSTKAGVLQAVTPGDPSNSTLYTRSFTTTFFVLNDEERETIRIWILNGAID